GDAASGLVEAPWPRFQGEQCADRPSDLAGSTIGRFANLFPGEPMPLSGLRPGCAVRMGPAKFLIRKKLADAQWQLENAETGEWCTFAEQDLLEQFARNELTFERNSDGRQASAIDKAAANLARDLSSYSSDLVGLAQTRVEYLKEIDRRQPMA